MKKILFLTTHNLATNPRLVKEIRLALSLNYTIEVICFEFRNWSRDNNEHLKKEFIQQGARFILIEAGKDDLVKWLYSVSGEKVSRLLSKANISSLRLLAMAQSRRNLLIRNAIKKATRPDLVIGHNPGALFATYAAAKKFSCKSGFDIEDYHPGEGDDGMASRRILQLMCRLLPEMTYVSFASGQIMEQVQKDVPGLSNNVVLLNYFPSEEFAAPGKVFRDEPVKMIWFSQHISTGRGLEIILDNYDHWKNTAELHLYGNKTVSADALVPKDLPGVFFHPPLSQKELHLELSKYDIGLALDLAVDRNRELTITNKLLTYFQAGLYIVASATNAQQSFLQQYPQHGCCFKNNEKGFGEAIDQVIHNIDSIRAKKTERFESAISNNWETESRKLALAWQQLF